jgi:hypothetical protein
MGCDLRATGHFVTVFVLRDQTTYIRRANVLNGMYRTGNFQSQRRKIYILHHMSIDLWAAFHNHFGRAKREEDFLHALHLIPVLKDW